MPIPVKLIPLTLVTLFCLPLAQAETPDPDVRLVLQLTVDGLRADLLARSWQRFEAGGFKRLQQQGTVFTNAHYQHANTETIVGHATLATGAQPSVHGMTGNVWFDASSGDLAYNIEDSDAPILPVRDASMAGDQVDPAQQLARSAGRSPRALLAETFADKLVSFSAGEARAFAVSGKDRGAVPMAGRAGKAFWMSADSGDFVTSAYYFESYPGWVAQWNAERKAETLAGGTWALLHAKETYVLGDRDNRPYETDLRGYGRTFPHTFGDAGDSLLYTQVIASPEGDRLTADFAQHLIINEALGRDGVPDYLSISFSGVDAVNHFFGPSSLENEDMVLQLDRTLAELFQFIDDEVGMEHVLVVLSADHGMAEMPEYMAEYGMDTGRLTTDRVTDLASSIGQDLFGVEGLVEFYYRPFVYLDAAVLTTAGLDRAEVATKMADRLTRERGIALAITPNDALAATESALITRVRNNLHSERSGDIYVVQSPYWFNFGKGPVAAMHGSPWAFDTHVPILFSGGQTPTQRVHRRVQPADVAPTLAALLGMTPPAASQGSVLTEVFTTTGTDDPKD